MKNDLINKIPNYGLTDEEKEIVITTYFKQLKKDIINIEKPEVATLWGTFTISFWKVGKHIKMIEKILENPVDTVSEKDLENYRVKKQKLEKILQIHNHVREHGKTSRSKKRPKESQDHTK